MTTSTKETPDETAQKYWLWAGLAAGICSFLGILLAPTPAGLTIEGQRLAAVTVMMAIFWVMQPIPIPATSLIPLALYPLLGILSAKDVSKVYADPNVFLFLGGFLIAIAIERWNLHKRISLHIISRVGSSPRMIVFGFMLTTAVLSMWISNTAAALLMMPIGLALISTLKETLTNVTPDEAERLTSKLTIPLLLGIAYAASCGGFATLVGTPTNVSMRGFWERQFVTQGYPSLSFAEWMIVFVPVMLLMLLSSVVVMCWHVRPFPHSDQLTRGFFRDRLQQLGKATPAEWRVGILFFVTAILWIFREPLVIGNRPILPSWPGMIVTALSWIGINAEFLRKLPDDSTVAISMGLLLFLLPGDRLPSGERPRLLTWADAERNIPWGMLLLFGGGFAMADAFSTTRLSEWIGQGFAGLLQDQPVLVLVLATCSLLTFLTEFTSNTATINTLLPILAAISVQLQIDPRWLMLPATISASCGFMMPVGTPPNALVFSTGKVPMTTMMRYGLILNILSVIFITLAMWFIAPGVMHIPFPEAAPPAP
ncbi:SLC13 family permease [Planctomicrobium sp. SH661]|uniref:SLC13 family permease n=1 Tax=Planctomicrobium sp. SH661 TaxID=3448124 RepID=UPI003F5BA1CC